MAHGDPDFDPEVWRGYLVDIIDDSVGSHMGMTTAEAHTLTPILTAGDLPPEAEETLRYYFRHLDDYETLPDDVAYMMEWSVNELREQILNASPRQIESYWDNAQEHYWRRDPQPAYGLGAIRRFRARY